MKISADTVKKVATLARLDVSAVELEQYTAQLNEVLEYFAKLDRVDVSGVEPTAHPAALGCRMRADASEISPTAAEIRRQAPQLEDDFFIVPNVID